MQEVRATKWCSPYEVELGWECRPPGDGGARGVVDEGAAYSRVIADRHVGHRKEERLTQCSGGGIEVSIAKELLVVLEEYGEVPFGCDVWREGWL
jgi:hypothetical protein